MMTILLFIIYTLCRSEYFFHLPDFCDTKASTAFGKYLHVEKMLSHIPLDGIGNLDVQ